MNNKSIDLNVLECIGENKEKRSHFYKSKFNKTRENKAILLILTDDECNSLKNNIMLLLEI